MVQSDFYFKRIIKRRQVLEKYPQKISDIVSEIVILSMRAPCVTLKRTKNYNLKVTINISEFVFLSILIVPLCRLTISLAIDNPTPDPSFLLDGER